MPAPINEPRSVLITGCSSGIGLCVAQGLARRGYRVFATARKAEDVARLRALGLESLELDLADSGSIERAVSAVLARTGGRLYALFNNGAYAQPGAVEDLSREALRENFEVNVFGTHELTCRVLPAMRAQGEGRIIQNSSVLGFISLPMRGSYNATKHALEALSDALRLELAGTGVHVAIIEPGPILSRFRQNAYAAFKRHIRPEHSRFAGVYAGMEGRLTREGAVAPGTLGPEAVLAKVVHALESPRPRVRYRVTWPTRLFAALRRLLPDAAMDWFLQRISRGENRPARTSPAKQQESSQ